MYYPVMLDLSEKKCVVIGGGTVALRKVHSLIHSGVTSYVISPDVHPEIEALSKNNQLHWIKRAFKSDDLKGAHVVICATDDPGLNQKAAEEAKRLGCLVNVVDQPELGNFLVPSVVRRGPLVISISTQGASPAFARFIRQKLENQFGAEYESWLGMMEKYREKVLKAVPEEEKRKAFFTEVASSDIPRRMSSGMSDQEVILYLDETLEKYR